MNKRTLAWIFVIMGTIVEAAGEIMLHIYKKDKEVSA